MSIDIEAVRARAEALDMLGSGSPEFAADPAIGQAADDILALLDEVERQERAVEACVRIRNQQAERAEKAEAERDRLRAFVDDVLREASEHPPIGTAWIARAHEKHLGKG